MAKPPAKGTKDSQSDSRETAAPRRLRCSVDEVGDGEINASFGQAFCFSAGGFGGRFLYVRPGGDRETGNGERQERDDPKHGDQNEAVVAPRTCITHGWPPLSVVGDRSALGDQAAHRAADASGN